MFASSLYAHNARLQHATRQFAHSYPWRDPIAVTLTLKKAIPTERGFAHLELDDARRNFAQFMSRLNKDAHGKAYRRFGRRIPVLAVTEGWTWNRLHYHAVLDCPDTMNRISMPHAIELAWLATPWGHEQMDIVTGADAGWTDYITKLRSKPDFGDAIDWGNTYLPR